MTLLTASLTVLAAAYLFISLFVLATKKGGYSHVRHTISEIGEVGSPHQGFVAFGLFLPVGLSLLAVAGLLHSTSSATAALALCVAVGYVVAALFPCDVGSPLSGSTRQAIHNAGGAVQYIGGGFALMILAETNDQPFRAAGFVVLGFAIAL